jgi:hypothetical protein
MAVEFKAGKWLTQVTKRRTMHDVASFIKMPLNTKDDEVDVICLVTENLNPHKDKAFYSFSVSKEFFTP